MYEGTRYEPEGVVDTFGWRMAVWQMVNRKYLKVPENLVVAEELSIDKKDSEFRWKISRCQCCHWSCHWKKRLEWPIVCHSWVDKMRWHDT